MLNNVWLLSLVIILIWGTLPVLLKKLMFKYPTHVVMLLSAIMFGIIGLSISMFFFQDIKKHVSTFTKYDWMTLAYIVIAGSLFSNILYMYALKKHNSTFVVTVTSIFPIVTLLFSALVLQEKMNRIAILGVFLVTAGIMCLALSDKK